MLTLEESFYIQSGKILYHKQTASFHYCFIREQYKYRYML